MIFKRHSLMERKLDDFVHLRCIQTKELKRELSFQELRKYIMEARICVAFWASDASLDRAQANALTAIRQGIFGDIVPMLSRLRVAIDGGSREDAFKWCDQIDTFIRKGKP
mgnify:CR=1 FL=1